MFKRSSLRHQQASLILEHPMEETKRLKDDAQGKQGWRRWGPYLSERQWGTRREDYSAEGNPWNYLPHDHARSRSYRWGEDGLLGITDEECQLCFGLALWNEKDPILKERFFGLTPSEGNHGEDVKECYYYLDSTPTHSYMKALYKYPQNEYPYCRLLEENGRRSKHEPEYELLETGAFDNNRYWDIDIEYAKNTPNDILINIMVTNRGPDRSRIHVLPTLWYRNTWIWGCRHDGWTGKPGIVETSRGAAECFHEGFGRFMFVNDVGPDNKLPEVLFTDNETNTWRLFNGSPNYTPYVKDAFHRYVVNGERSAVHPQKRGTKMASHYVIDLPPGGHHTLRCRLMAEDEISTSPFAERSFGAVLEKRRKEADEFYKAVIPDSLSPEERTVCRQAYASLLWNKMFYNYIVKDWLDGDEDMPTPSYSRYQGKNSDPDWYNLYARDVVCVPDKWEYSSISACDFAFQVLPMAKIDPEFAKSQVLLFLREWYMSANGQIPGPESDLDEAQPPVLAYACYRVYQMTERKDHRDIAFLAKCFHKLLINFTWWTNRKDAFGKSIFGGGIVGKTVKESFTCGTAEDKEQDQQTVVQADGTAWMAFYCAVMLGISLELSAHDSSYEDMACKFLEHFTQIADVMNNTLGFLWNEEHGFYYDHVHTGKHFRTTLHTRSISGLIPLLGCAVIEDEHIEKLPAFRQRLEWLLENKADLASKISLMDPTSESQRHRLLAIFSRERLVRVIKFMLDDKEFLSPFGIRSLSLVHKDCPVEVNCVCATEGQEEIRKVVYEGRYTPEESEGNTSDHGPIWLGLNFLIVDALERYDLFYGDTFKVDFPSYSGNRLRLHDVALELSHRLVSLFLPNDHGRRPCYGNSEKYTYDVYWNQLLQFYEYFNADNGLGYGASHNPAVVSRLLDKLASNR